MLNSTIRNKALAALALASTLGFASGAQAQDPPYLAFWSSIGSAGAIDPGSTASAKTMRAILTTGSTGTLIARYPVAPSIEFARNLGVLHLVANLIDPGAGASVSVSLIEVPVGKPGEQALSRAGRQLLTVNSTDDALGVVNACVDDGGELDLDFEANVYYIQAVLNWDALAQQPQAPQLRAVQLSVYRSKCR